ncbi:MAG: 16S rRNA (cytidine(1402)-2'-O)-methyltransferase [Spirulinaceae cyanobacterium SM2_1_0]|nr:16S rRNA (cytidine(1402)-2'-O)-methyltransferase [Spirulinaceae cyanobacterium SM2_1_0]
MPTGTLYIVGTPIGNLDDMTLRAIRVLQDVDYIAAEDTRHTGRLLQHFQITTPQLSYHQHNRRQRQGELIERLQAGASLALVSDAGMPGISDPGSELVQACRAAGIRVVPIPGACAAIAALAASGLPTDEFAFIGFLPAKGRARRERLTALSREPRTLVLYEAPHRLLTTLRDLAATCGEQRLVTLARELTKRYEELWQGTLAAAVAAYAEREPRGEFTLVLAAAEPEPLTARSPTELKAMLQERLSSGLSRSQACRQLAAETGRSRRQLYQLALELSVETPEA